MLTDSFRSYGTVGYTSALYDNRSGLTPHAAVHGLTQGRYNVPVSLEAIPELADAQYLFVSVDGDTQDVYAELVENPLWQTLSDRPPHLDA